LESSAYQAATAVITSATPRSAHVRAFARAATDANSAKVRQVEQVAGRSRSWHGTEVPTTTGTTAPTRSPATRPAARALRARSPPGVDQRAPSGSPGEHQSPAAPSATESGRSARAEAEEHDQQGRSAIAGLRSPWNPSTAWAAASAPRAQTAQRPGEDQDHSEQQRTERGAPAVLRRPYARSPTAPTRGSARTNRAVVVGRACQCIPCWRSGTS